MAETGVSIICLTYNHEKYIRQCLEGFVNQRTDFKFEVIIHDDASTDNTAQIIREYEKKYPQIIKPIYEKINQWSKHDGSLSRSVISHITGKYVALCEGDDYWTDEQKLQKQFQAMQQHTTCTMCVHRVTRVKEDGTPDGFSMPMTEVSPGNISSDNFIELICSHYIQTSSYFVKAEDYQNYLKNKPQFAKLSPVGDEAMLLYFGSIGEVFYFDEPMSCYRFQAEGSWSSRRKEASKTDKKDQWEKMIAMLNEFNLYSNKRYEKAIEQRILVFSYACEGINGNYRAMLKKEYRPIFRKTAFRSKVKVLALSIVQFLRKR